MRVATFNVHDNPRAVKRALPLADLIFFQEYPPGYDLPAGWDSCSGGKGVVTAYRTRTFEFLGADWHEAHGARRAVTPARGTLRVLLRHRRSGLPIWTMNGHRINGWKVTRDMLDRALFRLGLVGDAGRLRSHHLWRGQRYLDHVNLDRALLARAHDLTIGGGDYNDETPPALHPQERRLSSGRNDHLWMVRPTDSEARVSVAEADTPGKLGSDHVMRRVRLRLRRKQGVQAWRTGG